MIAHNRIMDESSKYISRLLTMALEGSLQGEMDVVNKLGLTIEIMQKLERLQGDQINTLASSYCRTLDHAEILPLQIPRLTKIITVAEDEIKYREMIDEFISRGASKKLMMNVFGMRSTNFAQRRKMLNAEQNIGRSKVLPLEQQQIIYDAWISCNEDDFRVRLLNVARATDVSLANIYNEVCLIEENTRLNQKPTDNC